MFDSELTENEGDEEDEEEAEEEEESIAGMQRTRNQRDNTEEARSSQASAASDSRATPAHNTAEQTIREDQCNDWQFWKLPVAQLDEADLDL